MIKLRIVLPLLAALTVSASGCSDDVEPGSLNVEYVLGNSKSCAELGIETVQAFLYQDDMPMFEGEDNCQTGTIEITGVDAGNYDLLVRAIDGEGFPALDNNGSPTAQRVVEIFEGGQAQPLVTLTAAPVELELRWQVDDGFGSCESAGIDKFRVQAFQTDGANLLLSTELPCTQIGGPGGYRPIEDPERTLNGSLFGEVGIQGLASDGSSLGDAATFEFEPPGDGRTIRLSIDCTVDGCFGTGDPD